MENIGIYIGNTKEVVNAVEDVILKILEVPHCDEKTKQLALKALGDSLRVSGASLSNCNVQMQPPQTYSNFRYNDEEVEDTDEEGETYER